jgi:hypothetical protein
MCSPLRNDGRRRSQVLFFRAAAARCFCPRPASARSIRICVVKGIWMPGSSPKGGLNRVQQLHALAFTHRHYDLLGGLIKGHAFTVALVTLPIIQRACLKGGGDRGCSLGCSFPQNSTYPGFTQSKPCYTFDGVRECWTSLIPAPRQVKGQIHRSACPCRDDPLTLTQT